MIRVGQISHPDKVVDLKVKTFYDSFYYSLSKNRDLSRFLIENHITVLERIKLRAIRFSNHPSTSSVVDHYFTFHPLINIKSDPIARKGEVKSHLSTIRHQWKSKQFEELILTIDNLNSYLSNDLHEKASSYFQGILYNLVEVLTSKDDISKAKDIIVYYSNLLSSEFVRIGFDTKEILGISGIFNRILSNNFEVDKKGGSQVYSSFPLPERIENFRETKEFVAKIEEFFKGRSFLEQFEGIYSIYNKENEGYYLFRIDDVSLYACLELYQ